MAHSQQRSPIGVKVASGVIVAGLAVLLAHDGFRAPWPGVLPGSWWEWLYNAIEVAATVLCAARLAARRPDRLAWSAITLGMGFFTAADLYYGIAFPNPSDVPFPSIDDALYLAFYPCMYVGIALLLRARVRGLPAGVWLDGLIGALAVASVGAAVVFGAVMSNTRGAPLAVATNLAYPLADLLLLGILVGVMALTNFRVRGDWLALALGFAVFAVVDSVYLVQVADNTYVNDHLLDVGWPAALALIAVAAWRPTGAKVTHRVEGWGTFTVPALAAVACTGVEFSDHFTRVSLIAHALATICLLTVIVRLGLTFGENLRMLHESRRESLIDALTGLGNRRAVELDLEARLSGDPVAPFVLAYYDLDGFKAYNDTFGHQAGDALLTRLGDRLRRAVPQASIFRMGGDEFCLIATEAAGGAHLADRAAGALREHGSRFVVSCSYGVVRVPAEATDRDTAMLLADTRMYERKGARRPSAAAESQEVLMRALAERSRDLGQHNDDVTELVEAVAAELGVTHPSIVPLLRAAELHDVGKLAIPDTILNKPGPLDEHEWAFMRRHTIVGERIVASATSLRDVAPIVRSSHERWDGDGYPDRLAGEDIPLGSRIIAVCDAYDAMITTRPYRAGMPAEQALAELRRCSGTQFDPQVVSAFERVLADRADDAAATVADAAAAVDADAAGEMAAA